MVGQFPQNNDKEKYNFLWLFWGAWACIEKIANFLALLDVDNM